jgi:tetratricopeptide (TPR) repeat protein
MRGTQRTTGATWEPISVKALEERHATALFCTIAQAPEDDPALPRVLEVLEGVPLAITLLAHVAEGASLTELMAEWKKKRSALLVKEGEEETRETSWRVSIALSVESPRMTDAARKLAALLGRLPDGVALRDLDAVLPKQGPEAQRKLVQVGLAYLEEERLRVLAPVRAYLRDMLKVQRKDLARVMAHYGEMAHKLGPMVGRQGGAEASARLAPEVGNLDAMIREGLQGSASARWIEAAVALTNFARHSGRSSPSPLDAAREAAHKAGATLKEARCLESLGDIAFARSDHEGARVWYEKALTIYRRAGDELGEANCIQALGDIALARSDQEESRARNEEALRIYRRVGNVLGEANSIRSLGDIALARSDREGARVRYEEARPLFRSVGDVLGEAICIACLGNIALARLDQEGARVQFEEALLLFRSVGDVLGEANCIRWLGEIARTGGEPAQARKRYLEALSLYTRIAEPYSMGLAHRDLSRLAKDPAEKRHHVDQARALWSQIKLDHMVAELDKEFGPPG